MNCLISLHIDGRNDSCPMIHLKGTELILLHVLCRYGHRDTDRLIYTGLYISRSSAVKVHMLIISFITFLSSYVVSDLIVNHVICSRRTRDQKSHPSKIDIMDSLEMYEERCSSVAFSKSQQFLYTCTAGSGALFSHSLTLQHSCLPYTYCT